MYRKLVFVLTMFAVTFGSLSQVQAALATQRPAAPVASVAHAGTPASIATHGATGAVRPAAAGRPMAHDARLRTEQRQGSLRLGGDRRATGTTSAPTITSARRQSNTACSITGPESTTFTTGLAGSFTVTSTGSPTCALSETGTLPAGVTFKDNKDGTATLAGTPAADTGGTYTVTITARNGVTPAATQAFTLTVYQACQITSHDHATFGVGQAGTFTVATTGVPNCGLLESGELPSGVTFTDSGNGTAAISGTPTTGGVYLLGIIAGNGIGGNAAQTVTLTVRQSPQITSPAGTTFTVGQAGTFTVASTGVPNSRLSETGALPAGVTFKDNKDGTATLAGTPAADTGGTYTVTITARNGVGPAATQAFTLTVYQACQITSHDHATFGVGQAGTFTVATTGVPNCGLFESGNLPPGVTFTDSGNGTATISGTPTTGGVYLLGIIAGNGIGGNAAQTVTLTVRQSPQITSPVGTTFTVGQAGTFTVTSTGVPNSTLSESGKLPSGVTFTDNGDGTATLAGTPAAGAGGEYPFRITAKNGVSPAATQAFALTVNQAPGITSADHTTCTVRKACAFTVTSTGVSTPGLSEEGALPRGVKFKDNQDGTAALSGTPAAGTGGTYPFTIAAKNGVSPDATQSFTLIVVGPPAAPSGLKATSRGRTVSLTWTNNASAPSAATAIQIQRSTNARFTSAVTNTVVGPTVTSRRDTVVPGKKYYYRVRAHNAVGFSSWSNTASS